MAKIENNIVLKIENEIISNYEVKNKILSSLNAEWSRDKSKKYK